MEYGYFENPKKVKLKELALEMSEATALVLIRKAMKKVVEHFIYSSGLN